MQTMKGKPVILAVDDTPESLALLIQTLSQENYQVRPADSGELALAAAAAQPPDMVLLDMRMKGLDGLEVLRRLKADEATRNIPVILVSAFADTREWVEGLTLGAVDYITKPFQTEELLTRVRTHIALCQARESLVEQAKMLRRNNEELQREITLRQEAEVTLRQHLDRGERSRRAALSALEDQHRTAASLRESEEKYRTLINKMMNAFGLHEMIFDDRGEPIDYRFLEVNPAWEKTVGIKAEMVIGKTIREIMPNIEERWIQFYGSIVKAGIPQEIEDYNAATNKYYQVYAYCPSDGKFAVFFNDITQRKLAEAEVKNLNQKLELRVEARTQELQDSQLALLNVVDDLNRQTKNLDAAVEKMAAANNELEAFTYSVSHDLRAPLRSIDGFSQAILEDCGGQLDREGREYLERVRRATQRMGRLIDDLLKLSRLGKLDLRRMRVDLTAIAKKILQNLRESDPGRVVEVVLQEGILVEGDPGLLGVVLENLLGNAWKFTAKTPHPRIEFGWAEGKGQQTCFIRDNGGGFDMAYAGKLVGAFQRLHTQEEFPGTGIGLATVRRILTRHGGRVWAEAKPGQGATFYFSVPAGP